MWNSTQPPEELNQLILRLGSLPPDDRLQLTQLVRCLARYIKVNNANARLLRQQKKELEDTINELELNITYLQFDLEITIKERNALFDELHGK